MKFVKNILENTFNRFFSHLEFTFLFYTNILYIYILENVEILQQKYSNLFST